MNSIIQNIHRNKDGIQNLTLRDNIIGYIIHGTLRIHNNEVRYIQQGVIFTLRAGDYQVEYLTNDYYPYEEIVIHLSHAVLRNIIYKSSYRDVEQSAYTPTPHNHILTNHTLSLYFQEIRNYIILKIFDHCEPMEYIKINELVNLILCEPTSPVAQSLLPLIDNKTEFVKHIQASLFRNVTIEKLATECGMSLSTFKHTFLKHFDCTPHHWFITNRLHTVCNLLKHTCDPIKTIACECGFSTPSHMIRLFHSHYGITPAQYRASHNKHNTILNNLDILLK